MGALMQDFCRASDQHCGDVQDPGASSRVNRMQFIAPPNQKPLKESAGALDRLLYRVGSIF
jgi:hypothetical protein